MGKTCSSRMIPHLELKRKLCIPGDAKVSRVKMDLYGGFLMTEDGMSK